MALWVFSERFRRAMMSSFLLLLRSLLTSEGCRTGKLRDSVLLVENQFLIRLQVRVERKNARLILKMHEHVNP